MGQCIRESEFDDSKYFVISGPYDSEGECVGGCDSSSSSSSGSSSSSSSSSSNSGIQHALQFYPITSQNVGKIYSGSRFVCSMSRVGGTVTASVNGSCPIVFSDSDNMAIPLDNTLLFCIDDLRVPGENSSGTIYRIELRQGSTPKHVYQLNGNLSDSLGGPSLVGNGGVVGAGGYVFGQDQGLSLTVNDMDWNNYTVIVDMKLDELANGRAWHRIMEFKKRSSDNGLYAFGGEPKSTC